MKRRMTALLTALLLALTLCIPAMAETGYSAFYDETGELGSVELSYAAEQTLPQLTQELGIDLRVDAFTDEDVDADTSVADIAVYVYENSGYGCGEKRDGVSLTLLLRSTEDGAYTLSETDWCVYALLDTARGSAQELSDVVRDAVAPYMVQRAWNGEDMTMSATALSQAVDAMVRSVEDYIRTSAPLDSTGVNTEAQAEEQAADMNYIFDLTDQLSFDEWAKLEARAEEISLRHGCGVYVAFVEDFTKYYGGNDVYKTTYQLYHSNELGMGENRDGIIILLSMDDRDYAMFVYGKNAEYAFNKYGQEQLEDAFLGYFGDNDWYGGASHYLDTCDEYLTLAEEGDPVRKNPLPMYLIVVAASCVISGIICLVMKGKLRTVHKKVEANEYVAAGGLTLTKQYDRYTHTTETRRKIHDDSDSGSTSSCSGGGGSGRSGKF